MWITLAVSQGFVLALWDDDGAIWPATWDGLERVVDTYYAGDIANKMKKHWPTLRSHTWDHLETLGKLSFSAIEEKEGQMTPEFYLQCEDSVFNARRFLANSLSVNRLFSGTGFTVDERNSGHKGTAEYFAVNRLLSSIPPPQLVNISL